MFGGGIPDAIPINYYQEFYGVASVNVKSIKFKPIDPFTTASIEFVEDEKDRLRLKINDINFDGHIKVTVKVLGFPLWGANIRAKGLNFVADMWFDDFYNVYPQIHIKPTLEAEDFNYTFSFVGWFIKIFLKPDKILHMIEDVIVSQMEGLNAKLRDPQPDSNLIGVMQSMLLNVGLVRPIDVSKVTDLIEFGIDGRCYDTESSAYITPRV